MVWVVLGDLGQSLTLAGTILGTSSLPKRGPPNRVGKRIPAHYPCDPGRWTAGGLDREGVSDPHKRPRRWLPTDSRGRRGSGPVTRPGPHVGRDQRGARGFPRVCPTGLESEFVKGCRPLAQVPSYRTEPDSLGRSHPRSNREVAEPVTQAINQATIDAATPSEMGPAVILSDRLKTLTIPFLSSGVTPCQYRYTPKAIAAASNV